MQSSNIPVLFITYNRLDYTKQSLPVLIENTPGARLIVIDNGSTDGTVEYLNEFQPGAFELILNKDNLGLGCAMNQFFEMTKDAEVIAKVDNDTVVPHLWLENMVGALTESGFDILQAAHHFMSAEFNGWKEIKEGNKIVPMKCGDIVVRPNVGGAGVVINRKIINGILPEDRGLMPWGEWQASRPGLKIGLYDGVWVDLLDMQECNQHKGTVDVDYYLETGRAKPNIGEVVSVIIPVVRPVSAERCIESVNKYLPGAEIVTDVDVDRIGCPKMVNRLTKKATREWIMFLGDDTELTEGVDQALSLAVDQIKVGVIGLNTEPGNPWAHWVAHRDMLDVMPEGVFFPECYGHCFCDNELFDVATESNKWIYAEGAVVKHHHPVNGGETDEHYLRAYPNGVSAIDRKIYVQRKRARLGKTAIGFPLVDSTVPVQFFASFACMAKPTEYTFLMPQFPHGPWTGSIADARNSLVIQAQMEGAKYLLMLDTDQVYPPETLTQILSHGLDICGVRVHRRWMPFDPIFYRGSIGKYKSVPDEEAFSGDLIEVDATGTGCLLFDMEVFDKIPYPWFQFHHHEGRPVGEDIYFCHKAREAGVKIHIDTAIEVGHLTTMEVNKSLYKICKPIRRQTPGLTG